jgi:hypothetical protein
LVDGAIIDEEVGGPVGEDERGSGGVGAYILLIYYAIITA